MSAPQVGIRLLSSLRRTKSKSALYEVPRQFFAIEEDLNAFDWLVDYVETHNAWPTPSTFLRETGITTVNTAEPISYYKDSARRHALWEAVLPLHKKMRDDLKVKDADGAMEIARQMVALEAEFNSQRSGLVSLASSVGLVMDDYDLAARSPGLRGIPTSFPFLDEMTDGLQNANMYTFVARPGVGKTWKLLRLAKAARDAGYSVLFLTMEMGIVQVARRFFGMETLINPKFLREGRLSTAVEQEMKRQAAQLQEGEGPPFFWLAGNFKKSVEALKAAAYETGADLVIADASYLMKPADRTKFNARHEILGNVMQGIHDLSTSVNRPVAQSVQFNRTAKQPKRGSDEEDRTNPFASMQLDAIAGTDEIGQLSSLIVGLRHGDSPNEDTERYGGILKGREGESGWYKYNYRFQPFDMSQISTMRDQRRANEGGQQPVDMSYMDADV